MKINSVVRVTNGNMGRNVAFGRAPKKGSEEIAYKKANLAGLEYLGVQNLAMIMHGPSFPADKEGYDAGMGTPYGADKIIDFLKLHGFNAMQLGPMGQLNKGDTSPYTSSVFEKSTLYVNEQMLTTDEFAGILSEEEIESITPRTPTPPKENYTRADYQKTKENKERLLSVAFDNFNFKLAQGDQKAAELNHEFEAFKQDNSDWLDYYGVLKVISNWHNTDFYPYWPQEDRDLIQGVKRGNAGAIARYEQIRQDHAKEIAQYEFSQFVIDKQAKLDALNRGDFTYIGDLEVGASSLDEVVFKDVFQKDYKVGCNNGGPFDAPQLWGISLLDPDKLFNPDGSLGPAGRFLKAKLKNGLSGAQNIRIDHIIGLVNPYIYKPASVVMLEKDGIKYPDAKQLDASRICDNPIDKNHNFQRILPEIIIPTLEEAGINPNKVVWEDLGWDESEQFQKIFKEKYKLPGIAGLRWTKASDVNPKYTAYIGGHDNLPGQQLIESGEYKQWEYCWDAKYLAETLIPGEGRDYERNVLQRKIEQDPHERWKAKVAEMLKTGAQTEQISFMDFFGIDKPYNVPGTTGSENWTLRLSPDYEQKYYEALENRESWAINLPEVLAMAIRAKRDQDIKNNKKSYDQAWQETYMILRELDKWAKTLKQK